MSTAHQANIPYPTYRDSGVDWLGEIPEHWGVLANKFIFELKKDTVGKESSEYTLLSLTLKGIIKRDMEKMEGKFPAEFDTYQKVFIDDFVFCLFDVEETPRTVGLSKFDGMITGAYTVLQVKENFDKNFLLYCFLNLDSRKMLKPLYKGLRNTIPKDAFFGFKICVPPLPEQQRIAGFLDNKTALIEKAIALKSQHIALLKERLQIIIQTTVTQGLNKTTPLKNTGVDWLGKIPEHWEVKKLKYCIKFSDNKLESKSTDLRYIGMECIESKNGKLNQIKSVAEGLATVFETGDILFGKLRPYLAKVYLAEFNGICSTEFLVCKLSDKILSSYTLNLFLSNKFIETVNSSTYGSKMPRANIDYIANIFLPIPPLPEQQQIADYLEQKSAETAQAIAVIERQLRLLQEYKTTLINASVTGKICLNPKEQS